MIDYVSLTSEAGTAIGAALGLSLLVALIAVFVQRSAR